MAKTSNRQSTVEQYDFTDIETVNYLTSQKNKFEKYRDKFAAEANTIERSLSGQLILLTTVLITVNVVALSNGELLNHLSDNQRWLILLAFFMETVATVAGIAHYFKMETLYNKWADAYQDAVKIIDERNFTTQPELANKVQGVQSNLDIHPPRPALKLQVACIAASFGAYLLLLIAILFNFHNSLNLL